MHVPWRRTLGAVLRPVPPYADVGPILVVTEPHPYLACWCGADLYQGRLATGAVVLACHDCGRYVDTRRVP